MSRTSESSSTWGRPGMKDTPSAMTTMMRAGCMPRRSAAAVTMIAPTRTRMSSSMTADSGSPGGSSPGTSVEEKKRHDAAGTPVTAGVVPSWASRSRIGWPPTSLSGHRAMLPPPPHAGGGNPLTGPPLSSRARTRCHFHITIGVRQDLVGQLSKVAPRSAYRRLRDRQASSDWVLAVPSNAKNAR